MKIQARVKQDKRYLSGSHRRTYTSYEVFLTLGGEVIHSNNWHSPFSSMISGYDGVACNASDAKTRTIQEFAKKIKDLK